MNNKSFRFKPIETRYKGYRFRSRLEARWAVFFDTLGIEFQYEPEGYALDGIPYLPDFWLPEEKSFFEVKGEEPTEEEMEKAKRLALYAQRLVYISSGSIGLPPDDLSHNITLTTPPSLIKVKTLYDKHGHIASVDHQYPDTSTEVVWLLQKLYEAGIEATVHNNDFMLHQNKSWWEPSGTIENFIQEIHRQADLLERLVPTLKKHQQELVKALETEYGIENKFDEQQVLEGISEWVECTACGEIALLAGAGMPHMDCPKGKGKGHWNNDTTNLIAAYTAAREARF